MNNSITTVRRIKELPPQTIIIVFFILVFFSMHIGYLPGSDEYMQAQASLNLKADLGFTMLQHLHEIPDNCSNDCYPDHVYLSAWPPGYSLAVYLATFVLSPHTSLIAIKIIAIVTAYLSWSHLVIKYLCPNNYNLKLRIVTASFLTLVSFQSTTDAFLCASVPFLFAMYSEIVSGEVKPKTILVFNLAITIALLMKFQTIFLAMPFYLIAFVNFLLRKDLKNCALLLTFSLVPIITTSSYLALNYINTGYISTQMIDSINTLNDAMSKFLRLIANDTFIYLDTVLRKSFLITEYIEKFAEVIGIPRGIRQIATFMYFSLILTSLFYSLRALKKDKKLTFIKFIFIILLSNTLGLILLQSMSSSIDGSAFSPWVYYRYYTITSLLLLIALIAPKTQSFEKFQLFIAILFTAFTIVFIGMKAVEANRTFSTAKQVNDDLIIISHHSQTGSVLFFSNHQIWRTEWSTGRIHRYLLRDVLKLPKALPPKTGIVVACKKDNGGLIRKEASKHCSNINKYEEQLRSTVGRVQVIEDEQFIVLQGLK